MSKKRIFKRIHLFLHATCAICAHCHGEADPPPPPRASSEAEQRLLPLAGPCCFYFKRPFLFCLHLAALTPAEPRELHHRSPISVEINLDPRQPPPHPPTRTHTASLPNNEGIKPRSWACGISDGRPGVAEGITSGVCEAEAQWSAEGGVSGSAEHVTTTLPLPITPGEEREGRG